MKSGRFFISVILFVVTCIFLPERSLALWGFGETESKSGLNLDQGYDLNMVATVKGKVVSIDASKGSGPVVIVLRQGADVFHAIAAPPWFWSDRGIAIKPNDEIAVVGAKAQGRDGTMYVISSKISNLTTGDSVLLRNETGRPVWRGRGGGWNGRGMQRRYGGGTRSETGL